MRSLHRRNGSLLREVPPKWELSWGKCRPNCCHTRAGTLLRKVPAAIATATSGWGYSWWKCFQNYYHARVGILLREVLPKLLPRQSGNGPEEVLPKLLPHQSGNAPKESAAQTATIPEWGDINEGIAAMLEWGHLWKGRGPLLIAHQSRASE